MRGQTTEGDLNHLVISFSKDEFYALSRLLETEMEPQPVEPGPHSPREAKRGDTEAGRMSHKRHHKGGKDMNEIQEKLTDTINSLKELRSHYEAEVVAPDLPYSRSQHPGDMLDQIHSSLAYLHRALHAERDCVKD